MARVIWPDKALAELDQIAAYIRQFNPAAADSIKDRLFALGQSLAHLPNRGRPAPRSTRELVSVSPYVLRYRVVGGDVVILNVRHSRRRPLR